MASGSSEAGGFTCSFPGCYNNSKKHKAKFSFYNFPGDQNSRRQWLHNISRKDFRPTTGHRVCSAHFEVGSKTYQNNVPTVFPLQKSHPKVIKTPRRLLVRHKEEEIQEETEENKPTCPEENQIDSTNHCNNEPSLEDQIIELRQQIAALESRNSKLECEIRFGLKKFKSSDDDIQYYNGIENYAQFKALFDFLDGGVKYGKPQLSYVVIYHYVVWFLHYVVWFLHYVLWLLYYVVYLLCDVVSSLCFVDFTSGTKL